MITAVITQVVEDHKTFCKMFPVDDVIDTGSNPVISKIWVGDRRWHRG